MRYRINKLHPGLDGRQEGHGLIEKGRGQEKRWARRGK
jgi:hypothetical protein